VLNSQRCSFKQPPCFSPDTCCLHRYMFKSPAGQRTSRYTDPESMAPSKPSNPPTSLWTALRLVQETWPSLCVTRGDWTCPYRLPITARVSLGECVGIKLFSSKRTCIVLAERGIGVTRGQHSHLTYNFLLFHTLKFFLVFLLEN